jgi:cytochrome P450
MSLEGPIGVAVTSHQARAGAATLARGLSVEQAVKDAFDPAWRHDPYGAYAVLRDAGPFVPGPLGLTLVPRYEQCHEILTDPVWIRAHEGELLHSSTREIDMPASFLWMEPPDHTRVRGLVSSAFTARSIERMREHGRRVAAELIDGALAAGEVDLVRAVSAQLPLILIAGVLGVPASEYGVMRQIGQALGRGIDPDDLMSPEEVAMRTAGVRAGMDFYRDLVRQRRADPREDVISTLAQAEAAGELTETEMLGTLVLLTGAGQTTTNMISGLFLMLARQPEQLDRLRRDPDLLAPAVDELFRFDGPTHLTARTARREVTVAGRTFGAGEGVLLILGSANRDPDAFTEPARFDIDRYARGNPVKRHLAFGQGLHYCIGAPLARLELEVLLRTLIERVSAVTLLADPPPYFPNLFLRGVASLRARLTAA